MRTITLTIAFSPEDDSFDDLEAGQLVASIKGALLRGYPYLAEHEIYVRARPNVMGSPAELSRIMRAFASAKSHVQRNRMTMVDGPEVRCAECGDTKAGPWGLYNGRLLCEACGEPR